MANLQITTEQMSVTNVDAHMVSELREAVKDCSARCLSVACKWASELLLSIPAAKRNVSQDASYPPPLPAKSSKDQPPTSTQPISTNGSGQGSSPQATAPPRHPQAPPLKGQSSGVKAQELEWERQEEDLLSTARAFMDAREYPRAVHLLRDCKSSKARFLHIYSQFMASEKKALRDWHKLDNDRRQPAIPLNGSLCELLEMVKNVTDPWLLFLQALFLSRLSRREEAIESALLSIAGYPWNWSAWSLLGSCIGDGEELSSMLPLIPLSTTHPLVHMFQVKTLNELHNPSDNELALCERLLGDDFFPQSLWIMSLRACVLYHSHDFPRAEAQFEKILEIDPYRIDEIDVYSNILYVNENRLKLSRLAHDFIALDKDRPEICCLVGNHYSLRADHEKAVRYFRRATQLEQTYLSAWTLMGHEYVEMKNSHAAIEAYRRAVDVNRKDYRAWYGLGQAYELLSMHQYALHYYQHATALRPYDVRLWQAQGICYEEIGRLREAIECLKRALIGADPHEISINQKLARLHHALDEHADAAAYHRRVVEVCQIDMKPLQDYAKSSIYVANHNMSVPGGDLLLAREYLEKIAGSNAEEVARAKEMLKVVELKIQERQKGKGKMVDVPVADAGGETAMVTDQ